MSSILDRLREVEGTTTPREPDAGKCPSPGRSPLTAGRGHRGWGSGVRVWLCRFVLGVLVLLIVLLVWRPWSSQPLARREGGGESRTVDRRAKGQAPMGKPFSVASNPQVAPPNGNAGFRVWGIGLRCPAQTPYPKPQAANQKATLSEPVPESSLSVAPPVADDAPTKAFLRTLTVTGIYQDASGYIAFINGRAMQEGDKIEQVEIAEITSGRITFAHKGKRYVLPLH
jgi:hypothetical protein